MVNIVQSVGGLSTGRQVLEVCIEPLESPNPSPSGDASAAVRYISVLTFCLEHRLPSII
jgi:hypothetical protein